jgi:LuxR family maltose regulon positive regulatory protein
MGGKSIAVLCYLHIGDLHRQMARLCEAHALYEEALHITERHTGRTDLPFCGYAYVSIGRNLRQWNQLEDAYRYTTKGLALCRDWNVADILALSYVELAYTQQALGNDEEARASMQEANQIMAGFSAWGVKYVAAHQVKMDLMRGDMAAVAHWSQASDLDFAAEFQFHREGEYLALARVLIAQKRFEEAHALIRRIHRIAEESGKQRTALETLILLAVLFSVQENVDQALVPLEEALAIAEPEGYVRIFVDEGRPLARLLGVARNRGLAPTYVRRLLDAFPADETPPAMVTAAQPDQSGLVEPLSERELEVLQYVAAGLTNRQIAERLYLSLNTIKVHNRNIYGKLGVNNRVQAVTRARELGLLPQS